MTRITDEMREAIKAELYCACDRCVASAEASYLAVFALDPEVVEMRAEISAHDAMMEMMGVRERARDAEIARLIADTHALVADARSATTCLISQGYVRGEDGTWGVPEQLPGVLGHSTGMRLFSDTVAQRAAVDPAFVGALEDLDRIESLEAELAALREKYKAITEDAVSGVETVQSVEHYYEEALDRRESELAALRPVVEAAEVYIRARRGLIVGKSAAEFIKPLEEAVRAWRERKR